MGEIGKGPDSSESARGQKAKKKIGSKNRVSPFYLTGFAVSLEQDNDRFRRGTFVTHVRGSLVLLDLSLLAPNSGPLSRVSSCAAIHGQRRGSTRAQVLA